MDTMLALNAFFALIFVLCLIGLTSFLLKKYNMANVSPKYKNNLGKRLSIVDVTTIDAKRRVILLRRDDVEHLILLGAEGETVIESKIIPPKGKLTEVSKHKKVA